MKLSEFYEIYLTDKKNELKYRTILTKRQMIETHILPYFGELPLDEITAQDIQNWQNKCMKRIMSRHICGVLQISFQEC